MWTVGESPERSVDGALFVLAAVEPRIECGRPASVASITGGRAATTVIDLARAALRDKARGNVELFEVPAAR